VGVVELERDGSGIALITLNRPEVLNAESRQMVDELTALLDQIAGDSSCRVVDVPSLAAAIEMENRTQVLCSQPPDQVEAISAFLQKWPAVFRGD
jgi:1,4-dihydroxy-2-naphthoyl-CoA synthase